MKPCTHANETRPPDSATQTVKHLVLELHGIAADRTESEHGTFHATALGMMYRDLFGHEAERRALRGAAERMLRVSRWPYERLMGYCAGV